MNYPFTAIVKQEKLKKALLLCAINPGIGGILIQGDKGTAKSTAARALAEVVPSITKINGCFFNCAVNDPVSFCEVCQYGDGETIQTQVPFINLPLGATEERVLGSLDLEAVLVDKKKKFQPGLLAAVHQGILYIDEVNLLPDHLVDVLLDVSAMGENIIEREGLSLSHPAKFTLIGTMNPEEGKLRPQFLDRFGLMVDIEAPTDINERTEVVRRRIAFEKDPTSFINHWAQSQNTLQHKLLIAKALLPSVNLSDELLTLVSELTTGLNVKSLRADIVIYKTAITIAALNQRTEVNADDIREAAELALAHRSRKHPFQESKSNGERQKSTEDKQAPKEPKKDNKGSQNDDQEQQHQPENKNGDVSEHIFGASVPLSLPQIELPKNQTKQIPQTGRRMVSTDAKRGLYIKSESAKNATDIAVEATVLNAIFRDPEKLDITLNDLQQKKRNGKTSNLILFVVDASGSMAANKRMEAVKGTVLSLLTDAYQKRDTVGVIAFRGIEAQVLLNPTQSVELAEEAMKSLPTGGRTPLPHALQTAVELLHQFNIQKGYHPVVVVLTDGKANVALPGGGDPWEQTLTLAAQLKSLNVHAMVLNTDSNYLNLNKAEELSKAMGGQYLSISDISQEQLTPVINQLL